MKRTRYCKDCKHKIDVIISPTKRIEFMCGLWEDKCKEVVYPTEIKREIVDKHLKNKIDEHIRKYGEYATELIADELLIRCDVFNDEGNCEFYKEKLSSKIINAIMGIWKKDKPEMDL